MRRTPRHRRSSWRLESVRGGRRSIQNARNAPLARAAVERTAAQPGVDLVIERLLCKVSAQELAPRLALSRCSASRRYVVVGGGGLRRPPALPNEMLPSPRPIIRYGSADLLLERTGYFSISGGRKGELHKGLAPRYSVSCRMKRRRVARETNQRVVAGVKASRLIAVRIVAECARCLAGGVGSAGNIGQG